VTGVQTCALPISTILNKPHLPEKAYNFAKSH